MHRVSVRQPPLFAATGLMAILLVGCGSEPAVPTTIVLNTTAVSFTAIGQTQQLSATVKDQRGDPITQPMVAWSSTNSGVATVSPEGLVTAAGAGSAQVTAAVGEVSAVATVVVELVPAELQKVSGDGQSGSSGLPLPLPLTVEVRDGLGNPIAGATVSFSVTQGGGSVVTPTRTTAATGQAATKFTLGTAGAPQEVIAAVVGTTLSVTFTATANPPFNIELRFLSTTTVAQAQAFTAAEQRWENLIAGDLADVILVVPADSCGANSPALNQTVDDVLILVTLEPIDGPLGVLGQAGPCFIRIANKLTVLGLMRFDTEDLDLIESVGLLSTVILHEMGHVLGFGTLWGLQGLLVDPSLAEPPGTDPHFIGVRALAAFDADGGAGYMGGEKIPVEDMGGEGTADAHWRESVFDNELMTGFVSLGSNPLSRITVESLADQGYAVSTAGADPYTVPLAPALRAQRAPAVLELWNDVIRQPITVVDPAGRVVEVLQP